MKLHPRLRLKKIEPYKGKGVREKGQHVLKKEGKKIMKLDTNKRSDLYKKALQVMEDPV